MYSFKSVTFSHFPYFAFSLCQAVRTSAIQRQYSCITRSSLALQLYCVIVSGEGHWVLKRVKTLRPVWAPQRTPLESLRAPTDLLAGREGLATPSQEPNPRSRPKNSCPGPRFNPVLLLPRKISVATSLVHAGMHRPYQSCPLCVITVALPAKTATRTGGVCRVIRCTVEAGGLIDRQQL